MLTTVDIIELVRLETEARTKYAAARRLGVLHQTLANWIVRGSVMRDETGLKAAEILDIDPDYILACLAAERAKDSPAFKTWAHICQRLTPQNMRESA